MTPTEMWNTIVAKGIPHANHAADLYVPVTPETQALMRQYEFATAVTTFVNQVEGGVWYDIPFAYQPYWAKPATIGKEVL